MANIKMANIKSEKSRTDGKLIKLPWPTKWLISTLANNPR